MLPQLIPEVLLKLFHNTFSALKGTNFSYTRKIKKKCVIPKSWPLTAKIRLKK